jgi:hypothetical protein
LAAGIRGEFFKRKRPSVDPKPRRGRTMMDTDVARIRIFPSIEIRHHEICIRVGFATTPLSII